MKKFKKVFALMLALACIMSLNASAFAMVAFDDDTIDYSKPASLNIYKYDMTSAAEDGAWTSSSFVSSGEFDQSIIDAMASYAVQHWMRMQTVWQKYWKKYMIEKFLF